MTPNHHHQGQGQPQETRLPVPPGMTHPQQRQFYQALEAHCQAQELDGTWQQLYLVTPERQVIASAIVSGPQGQKGITATGSLDEGVQSVTETNYFGTPASPWLNPEAYLEEKLTKGYVSFGLLQEVQEVAQEPWVQQQAVLGELQQRAGKLFVGAAVSGRIIGQDVAGSLRVNLEGQPTLISAISYTQTPNQAKGAIHILSTPEDEPAWWCHLLEGSVAWVPRACAICNKFIPPQGPCIHCLTRLRSQTLLASHRSVKDRSAAIEKLANLGGVDVIRIISELALRDPSGSIRMVAIRSIAQLLQGQSVTLIAPIAQKDPVPAVRSAAIEQLARLGGLEATKILIELATQDSAGSVRISAIQGVTHLSKEQALGLLIRIAQKDTEPAVRLTAVEGLIKLGEAERTLNILSYLSTHDPAESVRRLAAQGVKDWVKGQ